MLQRLALAIRFWVFHNPKDYTVHTKRAVNTNWNDSKAWKSCQNLLVLEHHCAGYFVNHKLHNGRVHIPCVRVWNRTEYRMVNNLWTVKEYGLYPLDHIRHFPSDCYLQDSKSFFCKSHEKIHQCWNLCSSFVNIHYVHAKCGNFGNSHWSLLAIS